MSDAVFGTSNATSDSKEFEEAKEEEVDSDLTFDVSKEEVSLIRAEIASTYPEDYNFLSNDYITSVASKPYSKDPTQRRPIEYTTSKLKDLMKWREENAVHLQEMYNLIPGESTNDSATDAVENAEMVTKAAALATSLNYGSMYWHGLDKMGRPVLWVRTDRMVCVWF